MNSYHVFELVGEGSFGRVHKGRKKRTGQVVALKFMPKVGRSEKELRNLKREIEIMRGLRHPNIVQLFDTFETETEVVVVTEYAEGQLFQILEDDGSLPESQVRKIACQLVSALYYLHSHRILHRDMKPQNILIEKTGVIKLCDFGFARAMSVSTLVLTSIKGTPLYMSPELVEEKPYDHTADLWSLGCILYELHTGAPPFYTNSIFHLVQLIVRDQVKWPETMSDTCTSFLKGLLTKDPLKRLSWPDLLHHPFVADGVLVLSDSSVSRPLTVTPSADVVAEKLKQVAEKSVPASSESRLLRKVREQKDGGSRRKQGGGQSASRKTDSPADAKTNSGTAAAAASVSNPKPVIGAAPVTAGQDGDETLSAQIQTYSASKRRGQISRDYEQEFPSTEVRPRLVRKCSGDVRAARHSEDVDAEEYWQNLVQASDPGRQHNGLINYTDIIAQLKSKILEFKAQLTGGCIKDAQMYHTLRVLRNLIATPDLEKTHHASRTLGLPHVLFDLIHKAAENSDCFQQPWFHSALGEVMTALVIYWETHGDCVEEEEEQRLEELGRAVNVFLTQPELRPLAPLAAAVLSQLTQHGVDVHTDVDKLTSLLNTLIAGSCEPLIVLPPGWGLCDGLLSLLLLALPEHETGPVSSCLTAALLNGLWKKIGASVATKTPELDFCSADGLYSFLSTVLYFFTKEPHSCIPLFTDQELKCVQTLGWLLGAESLRSVADGAPGGPEVDPSRDCLPALSCQLLCFPFALDLPPRTMSAVLQLYDSCGIVTHLLQVIRTLPHSLLELPLALLSRLLLCDPQRSLSHLRETASGFFSPPSDGQLAASTRRPPPARSGSSLFSDLLRQDGLWDSAVELLTVLSQIARGSPPRACFQPLVEAPVLHQALGHSYDPIRAATCRLLGSLDPFRPPSLSSVQLNIFTVMTGLLRDPCMLVRRTACWAVGNWLGYIAAIFKAGRTDGKCSGTAERERDEEQSVTDTLPTTARPMGGADEGRRWTEEARRTVASLAALVSDSDVLTRRHCCAALGNLGDDEGAVRSLLEEDVSGGLLRAACTDPDPSVRQAATATLCVFAQQDALRQVLVSLKARKKLLRASQNAPPHCDHYQQLIRQL